MIEGIFYLSEGRMALVYISPLHPEALHTAFLHGAYCNTCPHDVLRGDRRKFHLSLTSHILSGVSGRYYEEYILAPRLSTSHSRSPETTGNLMNVIVRESSCHNLLESLEGTKQEWFWETINCYEEQHNCFERFVSPNHVKGGTQALALHQQVFKAQ